ncbi:MAG: hypothetical protein M3N95_06140 [Actinomycetota bacterium]|nr:hypothetical protein [Actinomycetota bacterium]
MNPHIPALDADVHDGRVESLVHAEASRRPIEPLTATIPTLSAADANAIQTRIVARRVASRRVDGGERVVGRKVGLTSTAMQAQLGVAEPDFGVLFESMVIPSGTRLATDTLIAPRVEAEFAVRMGRDLSGPSVTLAQARDAVAEVMLALEIIDSRIIDWRIVLADFMPTTPRRRGSSWPPRPPRPRRRHRSCCSVCPTPNWSMPRTARLSTADPDPPCSAIPWRRWCGWPGV